MTEYIPDAKMIAWAKAEGFDAELHVSFFNDYLANKKGNYKCLDAAFRNCVRSDWGRIRFQSEMKAKKPADQWWATDAGIIRKGQSLGIHPRPGETMQNFKARINESIERTT